MAPLIRYYGALAISALAIVGSATIARVYPPALPVLALTAFGFFLYSFVGPKCPRCGTPVMGPGDFREWGNGIPGRHCKECEYDLLRIPGNPAPHAQTKEESRLSRFGDLTDRLGTVTSLLSTAFLVAIWAGCVVMIIVALCQALGYCPRPLVRF